MTADDSSRASARVHSDSSSASSPATSATVDFSDKYKSCRHAPDHLSRGQLFVGLALSAIASFFMVLAAWFVLDRTSLPAFNTSMVTRALTTASAAGVIVIVGGLILWWIIDRQRNRADDRPRWRVLVTYAVTYLSPAALTVTTLGIPLSATRLWLDGIQVDQVFRTQFLTRASTTISNQDMNYLDLPSYYPLGWFWTGGRFASLLGMPGWEVYQPWALVSIAVAASLLVPVWQSLTGSLPLATGLALTNTAVILAMAAIEPYAAIIALGVAPAAVMAHRALSGSWLATAGITVFLGISATMYTLFVGAVAVTLIVLTIAYWFFHSRTIWPFVHLAVMGFGSMAIAALAWGPYLYRVATVDYSPNSVAQHYLPKEGALTPLPFLEASALGVFCFIGLIYLVFRMSEPYLRTLLITVIVLYAWVIASMIMTLMGSTLLGFRLDVLIASVLATAGLLALTDVRLQRSVHQFFLQRTSAGSGSTGSGSTDSGSSAKASSSTREKLTIAMVVVLVGCAIGYIQQIASRNENAIDHAYTDTDGYGERADRYAPDAGKYYGAIDEAIREHGHEPTEAVVLTDENRFMAYHPYFGFNAFTSHYANPLGQFTERNEQIYNWGTESFTQLSDPEDFAAALDSAEWKAPDVFIFRGNAATNDTAEDGADDGYKTHLAEDIYPNQPNVVYRSLFFNPEVFNDEQLWHVEQIGPFVVVTRNLN